MFFAIDHARLYGLDTADAMGRVYGKITNFKSFGLCVS
jgi:hypothetical protein